MLSSYNNQRFEVYTVKMRNEIVFESSPYNFI